MFSLTLILFFFLDSILVHKIPNEVISSWHSYPGLRSQFMKLQNKWGSNSPFCYTTKSPSLARFSLSSAMRK